MWNNRNLEDKIQSNIENIIKTTVPDYDYGTRRETQTEVIVASKLFGPVVHISSNVQHQQSISECVEAWRSQPLSSVRRVPCSRRLSLKLKDI